MDWKCVDTEYNIWRKQIDAHGMAFQFIMPVGITDGTFSIYTNIIGIGNYSINDHYEYMRSYFKSFKDVPTEPGICINGSIAECIFKKELSTNGISIEQNLSNEEALDFITQFTKTN